MSLILDSVTTFPPDARGRAAIAASHGGVYAAYLAAKVGINDVVVTTAGLLSGDTPAHAHSAASASSEVVPCCSMSKATRSRPSLSILIVSGSIFERSFCAF